MAIENRNLEAGTRLVGRYKGKTTVCLVEAGTEGQVLFRLDGKDKTFTSLSAAATEITRGPINGWKFWTVEGAEPLKASTMQKVAKGSKVAPQKAKRSRPKHCMIRPHENQTELSEGETRYWCDGCMASFTAFEEPSQCANGHRVEDPELVAAVE